MMIGLTLGALLLAVLAPPAAFSVEVGSNRPADGKGIFLQRCAKCHGDNGEGVSAVITMAGPSLLAQHNAGRVMTAMEVGPGHMPSFAKLLSLGEMRAVADYVTQNLAVISLSQGDLTEGGKLFRVYCAPCHRTAVRGGGLVFAGTNAPALTDKSAAIVAGAVRSGPGPMPRFPPSIIDDKALSSIVAYVTYVQHPPSPGGASLNWFGPVAEGFVAWVIVLGMIGITGWIERGGKG